MLLKAPVFALELLDDEEVPIDDLEPVEAFCMPPDGVPPYINIRGSIGSILIPVPTLF